MKMIIRGDSCRFVVSLNTGLLKPVPELVRDVIDVV